MKHILILIFMALCLLFSSCPMERELPAPETTERVFPTLAERPSSVWNGKIKIASIFPTRGRYNISGTQSHNGAAMAVKDVNARGGIHGRELEMLLLSCMMGTMPTLLLSFIRAILLVVSLWGRL